MSQEDKRKRQRGDKQELWPDKRLKLIDVDKDDRKSPGQSLGSKATTSIRISLPPSASEVASMDLNTDDDSLPELTREITSSPDSQDTHLLDDFSQCENPSPLGPSPEPQVDQDKVQMLDDAALFSELLRSPSPTLSHTGVEYAKDDLQTRIPPQYISPADVCPSTERDPLLAHLPAEAVLDFQHENVRTKKKPRVTLHVRPRNAAPKRKVSLRLKPPKKVPKQALKPFEGTKNRSKRRV